MATYITPGRSEVSWVTTVAVPAIITAAEANAGVDITGFCRELPAVPRAAQLSDNSDLSSTFQSMQLGTSGGDEITVLIKRHIASADDTAYTTLDEGTVGFLVIARQGLATTGTFAVSDRVDVFPVIVSTLEDGTPGRTDIDTAIVHLPVTASPTRDQTIAA